MGIEERDFNEPIAGYVRTDFTVLNHAQTVGEALVYLRDQDLGEKIVYFYVVDDAGRLVGVVPVRRLLSSALGETIASIMVTRVISIPADSNVLLASELFLLHRLLALPVVDRERRLVGIVDISLFTDEVISLGQRREVENAFQLIGVNVALGQNASVWAGFKSRFPWLLCNITGGIVCALIAGRYESLIQIVTVLALFIPVVLALSESVSIQAMTITLQRLPHEKVSIGHLWRALRKEFWSAALLGLSSGVLLGAVNQVWKGDWMVSAALTGSVFLAMVSACLIGVAVPTLTRFFRISHIAAGPVVLATGDMLTLIFYFNLAGLLLDLRG